MYLFTGETLKTCYLLPLFLFGLPQFQVSKCPTSSFGFFSLQCKLLQKCTFSRPAIIYEIIIQLCLISVRRNEVGDAWRFLTVNRVISFIYIMPQGFLNSTPNWQTTLSAQAWKLTEHNAVSLPTQRSDRKRSRRDFKEERERQGLLGFQNGYSQGKMHHFITCSCISARGVTLSSGALSQPRFLSALSPLFALLSLEQLLTLWSRTGKGVLLQGLS